ncbi:MAG: hypothetical protein HY321_14770 [Armatimonadetes bacterium]|nr:hypothetical protein [Armatimonadota bacterium]
MTLTIDLPPQWEEAARRLASAQGKTVQELAVQWLERFLEEATEDAEDARIALQRWEALQRGDDSTVDLEAFFAELTDEGSETAADAV